MTFLRQLTLASALALAVGCSMDDLALEGLSCPCAEGWVCVDSVCYREDERPDAGSAPDLGSAEDFGVEVDQGVDLGVDQGTDAGPPDVGTDDDGSTVEPVDCSPLMGRENTEFCGATRDACSAEAYNMTTCDDLCAAADLVCLEAYDDLNPGCGPNREAPTTCDDATRMGYHCLCVRE